MWPIKISHLALEKRAESEPHWQIPHQKVNGLTLSREPHGKSAVEHILCKVSLRRLWQEPDAQTE
jgi:hypothetical protein